MKQIKVGADPFPPYQYYNAQGQVQGIDYDTVSAAFKAAGYDIEVELHDWPIVEKGLNDGVYSALFQVQPTPERLKTYYFSQLLREAATEVVTSRKDLTLQAYSEIPQKGLTLGVLAGYTNGPDINALPENCKKVYPDAQALLIAISRGEVDLGVYDRGVKEYLMEANGISNIYAIDSMTFTRPLHVIFLDRALGEAFDQGLTAIRQK